MATFSCESSLLWIYESTAHQIFYTNDSTLNVPESLGPFVVVQLNSIVTSADGTSITLSSTATVNVSSLTNMTTNVTITCDGNGDGVDGRDALLIVANGMFTSAGEIMTVGHLSGQNDRSTSVCSDKLTAHTTTQLIASFHSVNGLVVTQFEYYLLWLVLVTT